MSDPTTAWLNALAFLAGYGAAELQHRIRKHLRSMGPGPATPKPDIIPQGQGPGPVRYISVGYVVTGEQEEQFDG